MRPRALAFLLAVVVAGCVFVNAAGPALFNNFVDFGAELARAAVLSLSGLVLTFLVFRWLFNRFGLR